MTEKTKEQIEAEKATAKAKKEAEKVAAKAKRETAAAEKKAASEAKKAKQAVAREAAQAKKVAEREAKKAAKVAAREANRMPEVNGVRRPKPDTKCGIAWGIFDSVSKKSGAPASIGESMDLAKAKGLNEGNVRAEYARWRKFNGVTGRVANPNKAATATA